ncbi:MAG: hypothetical protein ACK55A_15825, partial [Gemmatimonas sp.]
MTRPPAQTPPPDGRPSGPAERGDGVGAGRRRGTKGSLGERLAGLPRGEQRSPRAVAVPVARHVLGGAALIQSLSRGDGQPL